jgi:hypothetical protein
MVVVLLGECRNVRHKRERIHEVLKLQLCNQGIFQLLPHNLPALPFSEK